MPILNCPCRFYTCNFQERIQLYIVLDGHDGTKACEFAQKHLPSVLLQSELEGGTEVVGRALRHAFLHTEREFFLRIDPQITRKITLQIEIQVSHCTSSPSLYMYLSIECPKFPLTHLLSFFYEHSPSSPPSFFACSRRPATLQRPCHYSQARWRRSNDWTTRSRVGRRPLWPSSITTTSTLRMLGTLVHFSVTKGQTTTCMWSSSPWTTPQETRMSCAGYRSVVWTQRNWGGTSGSVFSRTRDPLETTPSREDTGILKSSGTFSAVKATNESIVAGLTLLVIPRPCPASCHLQYGKAERACLQEDDIIDE